MSQQPKCTLCGGRHARSACPWDNRKDQTMRTVITGEIKPHHLEDAEFMCGITPTVFLTNGDAVPPASDIPVEVDPPSPMLPGELGVHQRNYTLCLRADALISVGGDPHIVKIAKSYGLPVYEA